MERSPTVGGIVPASIGGPVWMVTATAQVFQHMDGFHRCHSIQWADMVANKARVQNDRTKHTQAKKSNMI